MSRDHLFDLLIRTKYTIAAARDYIEQSARDMSPLDARYLPTIYTLTRLDDALDDLCDVEVDLIAESGEGKTTPKPEPPKLTITGGNGASAP